MTEITTPIDDLVSAVRAEALRRETLEAILRLVRTARSTADGIEGGTQQPDYSVAAELRAAAEVVAGGSEISLDGTNEEVGRSRVGVGPYPGKR
jgi:hypothetical protein